MKTFTEECDCAVSAVYNAQPEKWILSRAEEETALQPIVDKMLTIKDADKLRAWIIPGYFNASYAALAVSMYKAQKQEINVRGF